MSTNNPSSETTVEDIRRKAFRECAAIARKHAEEWRDIDGNRFAQSLHIEAEILVAGGIENE